MDYFYFANIQGTTKKISFYRVPSTSVSAGIQYWYVYKPEAISTVFTVEVDFVQRIAYGVLSECFAKIGNGDESAKFFKLYNNSINETIVDVTNGQQEQVAGRTRDDNGNIGETR